jgi:C4-dicarboxylate transporter DctQ subunit
MVWLSEGWETCSSWAAFVMLPRFPPVIAKFLDLAAQVMAIAFCVIMLKPSWNVMASAFQIGNVSSGLELPMWILYTSAPVGFFLGIVRGIEVLAISLKDFKKMLSERKGGGGE